MWITQSEGIIRREENGVYTNEQFVHSISEDTSDMGSFIQSFYSTPTNITLTGDIPDSWIQWSDTWSTKGDYGDFTFPQEIHGADRLILTRYRSSNRVRMILDGAGFHVVGRSIRQQGLPHTPDDAVRSIVNVLRYSVEKQTTGNMKKIDKKRISSAKIASISKVYNIVSRYDNIISCLYGNMYVEPILGTIKNLYFLHNATGENIIQHINDIYYKTCSDQVESVLTLKEYVQE